jgi:hypothetical protein
MEKSLENIYGAMLTESNDQKTVGKKITELEGSEKAQASNLEKTSGKIPADKPKEYGKNPDVEEGKGKPLTKKVEKAKESIEKPKMSFNDIYSKIIKENDDLDAVEPAADIESAGFSDEAGDFDPDADKEGDVEEEMDLTTELRLLADRLSEIAEKLGMDEGLTPDAGAGEGLDVPAGDDMGMEPEAKLESVQTGKIPQPTTPKLAKKTTLGPKMSMKPSNKIGNSGAGKASVPTGGKDVSGRLSPAKKTQFGPNMSKTVSGNGPAVQGKGDAFVK